MAPEILVMTPEESELAQHLRSIPEEAWVIAERADIPAWQASERLEGMANKGLVSVYREAGEMPKYHPVQTSMAV